MTDIFEKQRPRLMGLAYRMLGSVTEAEDIIQDAWVRWHNIDQTVIDSPPSFLSTIVTRLCLDQLRATKRKRETYIGAWLPEPLLEQNNLGDKMRPDHAKEIADDVSFALILTLEKLSPAERAAFLLHDVFDLGFDEIANTLDRSEPSCRKLASRARQKVRDHRPETRPAHKIQEPLITSFHQALKTGDLDGFSKFLADDAVMVTDGGGIKSATFNPIYGREKIMRFFVNLLKKNPQPKAFAFKLISINANPGILIKEPDGSLQTWSIDWTDAGQIAQLYIVRNPEKLGHVVFE
ncbi:sigma-70 family RNA polymerase sigma factor [Maritalea sp.]|uniref:sigma-70 family RNA polymerase sigma factor n=1 Tax=Maritalea sp. TaxID=2003361 RepID=UPI003EF55A6F